MPPPLPPSLSAPLARGGLADSPSSPRPPSMRRAGARAEMRQRPPFVLHTSELAGGRGEPFLGKWSCAGSHGTSYALRAAEAAVVALKRPGIQGMRGTEAGEEGADRKRESRHRALSLPFPPYRLHASALGWILSSPHAYSSVAYAERRVRPTDKCVAWIEILCTQGIKARERARRRRRSCSWPSTSARSASLRKTTKPRSPKI